MEQKATKLPLVEYISRLFGNVDLRKALVIGCQHIQKPQFQMFLSLFEKGLDPKNTFLLGKCYSTDKEALSLFVEKGVKVHKASEWYDSHTSYDKERRNHVRDFLQGILIQVDITNYEKVIILDDGGFLLALANEHLNKTDNVFGVEQTSSGYERLKSLKLKFPVVNVARSKAKLVYETPIIVNQFVKNLRYELKRIQKNPKKVLIWGNGAIGRGIAQSLRNDYEVLVYDINREYSDFQTFEDLNSRVGDFDLIIGCVGKSAFPLSLYNKLKKNAILASVSSSDREFSAPHIRLLDEKNNDCHRNIRLRDLHILNSGFPITFTQHSIGVDSKDMQLTMALLFSGICFSYVSDIHSGIVELDDFLQNKVIQIFEELRT